ncbi:hypothetical protein EFP30_06170 [Lactiplantibacillus pentosus]|nr:hypothetical protein [Lactiplantibacillus pentosus]
MTLNLPISKFQPFHYLHQLIIDTGGSSFTYYQQQQQKFRFSKITRYVSSKERIIIRLMSSLGIAIDGVEFVNFILINQKNNDA